MHGVEAYADVELQGAEHGTKGAENSVEEIVDRNRVSFVLANA
jgi:hypothetical protein